MFARYIGMFALVLAFVLAFSSMPIDAAKPSPTLVVSAGSGPTSTGIVPAYSTFYATGCGYQVGKKVQSQLIEEAVPWTTLWFETTADANGCIAFSGPTYAAGQYTLKAYQSQGSSLRLAASAAFTVK